MAATLVRYSVRGVRANKGSNSIDSSDQVEHTRKTHRVNTHPMGPLCGKISCQGAGFSERPLRYQVA